MSEYEYTADEARTAIDELLVKHGVTMVAAFVPQSLSRNSTERTHSLNWRVTFSRPVSQLPSRTDAQSFALDYMQGIGHVPNYNPNARTVYEYEAQGKPWEEGFYNPRPRISAMYRKRLPRPRAADILHSIVLDGMATDESFEEWCSGCGYDTDSRKAEAIYQACRKEHTDAVRVLGRELLTEAQRILQDY